jgi:hypothetical protein
MIVDARPGLDPRRLARLIAASVDRCELELSGFTVLTEAATGGYVVTPVLAAAAGADVYALAAATAYGSAEEIQGVTLELAKLAGVADRIQFIHAKDTAYVSAADIVTNSGQVRPIDAKMVAEMKPSAVVPLMYEDWEHRPSDVDLEACRARGIAVAGTNEQHPYVDIFSFLGPMALKQLYDAGIAVRGNRIVLLCDNSFGPFIRQGLEDAGAEVAEADRLTADVLAPHCDVVLLAMQEEEHALTAADAALLGDAAPGAVVVQYLGSADRDAMKAAGVPVWPDKAPKPGHMGILPSALGPEPIIRLQVGGLKVGQLLVQGLEKASAEDLALVQPL